jgi:CheY-like chemotaxis protein
VRVLVADDDRIMSLLLATRFRARGWTVDVAFDSMQAVMFATRNAPDVITLDIDMPGGTGLEVLRKLKTSARTAQVPVIVVSGSVDPREESTVMSLGAAAFVRKPGDPDQLAELICRLTGTPFSDGATPGRAELP